MDAVYVVGAAIIGAGATPTHLEIWHYRAKHALNDGFRKIGMRRSVSEDAVQDGQTGESTGYEG